MFVPWTNLKWKLSSGNKIHVISCNMYLNCERCWPTNARIFVCKKLQEQNVVCLHVFPPFSYVVSVFVASSNIVFCTSHMFFVSSVVLFSLLLPLAYGCILRSVEDRMMSLANGSKKKRHSTYLYMETAKNMSRPKIHVSTYILHVF